MKKKLFLLIPVLALTACDLSGLIKHSYIYSDEPLPDHDGVGLNIICNNDLLAKRNGDNENYSNLSFSPIPLKVSTVKILDGKITFYQPPMFGREQLDEVNEENQSYCYFEQEIVFEFDKNSTKKADFIYISDISFTASNQDSKLFKNLRVAMLDGSNDDYYYSLSYDEKGTVTNTEMNLDLNGDGELDRDIDGDLYTYTTGMPVYATNPYDLTIPRETDIKNDKFDKIFKFIKPNKPVTFRVWVEGWDLTNEDSNELKRADITLSFTAHEI